MIITIHTPVVIHLLYSNYIAIIYMYIICIIDKAV